MGRTNTAGVKGCAWQAHPVLSFFIIFLLVAGMIPIWESVYAQTDISDQIQINYSRPLYDRRARITSYDVTLTNTGGVSVSSPIKVIIESISSGQVSVANPDGTTTDGKPYFDYSDFLGDGVLDSQETSQAKKWKFNNPTRTRFTVQTRVLGGEEEYGPPDIAITNPVDDGIISDATPFITILFNDTDSGIDTSSFEIEINGVNSTSLFDVTGTGASCQYDPGLPQGINVISATISNNHGISNSASATFNVATSAEENLYVFSLEENPWLFASPGDGTYAEYLSPQDLGVDGTDVTSLAMSGSGNHYFTQLGGSQILQSMGGGTNSLYLTYAQLGLVDSELDALHLMLNGSVIFSLLDQQDLYYSTGNNSNSLFITNNDLGVPDKEITALHIGYDGLIYFAVPSDASEDGVAIYQSAGDGNCSLFLTSVDLGVPGSEVDAFAMVPDTDAPGIAITSPTEGAFLNTTTPVITVVFSDDYAGIDTSSFNLAINGVDYTDQCTVTGTGADCQVTNDLPVGSNIAVATISDLAGNQASDSSTFQIGVIRAIPGATPTSGPSPLTVHFTTDGEDPAGTIQVFRWDFDGNGSWDTYDTVARDYNHTYNTAGTYAATLFVRSSTGETATASITITVENNPPVATADVVPSNGEVPLTVTLYGSGSDPDGSIVLYEWDFDGDGTYDWSSTTTGNTSYTYNGVGTYQAVFRVTDNDGLTATAVATTTVVRAGPPGSPTVTASANPTSGNAPLTVNFSGTATDPNNAIALYEWDFDGDGAYDWSSPSTGNTSHTYNTVGTHVASLRVTDDTGLTGIDQILITVNIQTSLSIEKDTVGFLPEGSSAISSATASSQYSSSYAPSKAIDGNTGTIWHSANEYGSSNCFFEVSFNTPQRISGFTVRWYSTYYMYTSARIDIFDINGDSVYSQETALSGANSQVSLSNVENAFRLRLTAITRSNPNWTVIREFEVDSTPMSGADEPTGTNINTSISAATKVSILIKDSDGNTVRTLVNNEDRNLGSYSDYWNCKDDGGVVVNDGVYYAILQYIADGKVQTYDLTDSTGGTRYSFPTGSGCNRRDRMTKPNFSPYNDDFCPIVFRLCKASEVTVFIGPLWSGGSVTRVRTIINRKALPAGSHTVYWDGLDDQGNIAHPPPGDRLILGMWRYSLPDNAIYMTGGRPIVLNVSSDPNYFNPLSKTCLENADSVQTTYTLSEDVNTVELRVIDLSTSNTVRVVRQFNVAAGENHIYWDGRYNDGKYADSGDYQLGLIATDVEGNESLLSYSTLIRVYH